MLPQILLSGLIFPLSSIAAGVRWISYLLPLTYFNEISRGVMLRAEPIGPLWQPFVFLALLGVVVVTLAILRFRRYLAPAAGRRRLRRRGPGQTGATAGNVVAARAGGRQPRRGPWPRSALGPRAAARMTSSAMSGGGGTEVLPGFGASGLRLRYGDTLALDRCPLDLRAGSGHRRRRRRRRGQDLAAALPGGRAQAGSRPASHARLAADRLPSGELWHSIRTSPWRRTWPSVPPHTGCPVPPLTSASRSWSTALA